MLTSPDVVTALERAEQELRTLLGDTERQIDAAAGEFEGLARETDGVLELAASVIGCVEAQNVRSILPSVQSLGGAARSFIQERLGATAGILKTVKEEARLLDRLSQLTRGQRSVAREIQSLSVLTNIEVARLNELGAGFQYLARQLDDFSLSVAKGTKELAGHTEERKRSIETTQRMLAVEVPRVQEELARIETDLGKALGTVDAGLNELGQAPAHFRGCVVEIAARIAGVVAAIQAHDITRQQLEHVRDALEQIAAMHAGLGPMDAGEVVGDEAGADQVRGRISTGLMIQVYQLRSIRDTMGDWVTQIRICMAGILEIGSSELIAIGPLVLEQERNLSKEVARIAMLEQECRCYSGEVEETLAGLSRLMRLVREHLARSKSVRDRLQLLTFNSIIEASRLGSQADAILEISQNIKRIGTAWSGMTDQSAQAMQEILGLVESGKVRTNAHTEGSSGALAEAQAETGVALESLRAAAEFAAQRAAGIDESIGRLKRKIAGLGAVADLLSRCTSRINAVLDDIEAVQEELASTGAHAGSPSDSHRGSLAGCSWADAEALFAGCYTTEMEREVLRAALVGGPLPTALQNFAGNDVELF